MAMPPFSYESLTKKPRYLAYAARSRLMKPLRRCFNRSSNNAKMIIFDPALVGYNGHHLELTKTLRTEFGSAFDIVSFVNFRASNRVVASLRAQPVCYDTMYPPSPSTHASRESFESLNREKTRAMVASLRKIDLRDLRPDTIMVIHTATVYQLDGLAQWVAELPEAKRPKLFLLFHHPLDSYINIEDRPRALASATAAVASLRRATVARFAATSPSLARQLSDQFESSVAAMPFPIRWLDLTKLAAPLPGAVFGFFGGLRLEKGAAILADTIPDFVRIYPDTKFIVHAPPGESDEAAVRILARIPQVQLIRLLYRDKESYFSSLSRAGCILLPYDPLSYTRRISGVFLEALGLGRLIVTTKGTWMDDVLQERGVTAITMPSYTVKDFAECLRAARIHLLDQRTPPSPDREVISTYSGPAFCKALIELMQD